MKDLLPDDRPREKLRASRRRGARRQRARRAGARQRLAARRRAERRQRRCWRRAAACTAWRAATLRRSGARSRASAARGRRRSSRRSSWAGGRWRTRRASGCSFARRATRRRILLPRFGRAPVEQFGIVLLDTKHRVLRTAVLAVGTLNSCGRRAARRVSRGGPRRRGGDRGFSQSSLRRSHPEPRRCGVDAAAGRRPGC